MVAANPCPLTGGARSNGRTADRPEAAHGRRIDWRTVAANPAARSNGGRLADGGGVPMFAGIADRPEAGRGANRARRVRWWRRNQGGGRLAGIGAGLADAFRRLETGLQGRGTAGRARIRPARADATAGVYAAFPAMVADWRRNQGATRARTVERRTACRWWRRSDVRRNPAAHGRTVEPLTGRKRDAAHGRHGLPDRLARRVRW